MLTLLHNPPHLRRDLQVARLPRRSHLYCFHRNGSRAHTRLVCLCSVRGQCPTYESSGPTALVSYSPSTADLPLHLVTRRSSHAPLSGYLSCWSPPLCPDATSFPSWQTPSETPSGSAPRARCYVTSSLVPRDHVGRFEPWLALWGGRVLFSCRLGSRQLVSGLHPVS